MSSLISSRVAALLPALQHASGAFAALAAGTATRYTSQVALLEPQRAASAQSAPSGSTSGGPPSALPVTPNVAASPLDAFQSKLQSKTEQEILKLMEEARAAKLGAGSEEPEEEHEGEEVCDTALPRRACRITLVAPSVFQGFPHRSWWSHLLIILHRQLCFCFVGAQPRHWGAVRATRPGANSLWYVAAALCRTPFP